MTNAKLIFDCPERNADLYYATKFLVVDDILFLECRGKKYLILSDLEFNRGRREAKGVTIFSLSEWMQKAKQGGFEVSSTGVIMALLKKFKIKNVTVPKKTPFTLVDALRKKGFRVEAGTHPFYLERTLKKPIEKKWMEHCQRTTFKAIGVAEKILREASVKRGLLYWKGKILTSEQVRFQIDRFLLENSFQSVTKAIIAGGLQGCDPHCIGSGPLRPHQAIIVDIFPRSTQTRFFGDATRTFCKGKASPQLKKQYAAVKFAQEMAITKVKAGVNGKIIHQAIQNHFEQEGFQTKMIDGYRQGFIHGTGHGLGLEIHEEPTRISTTDYILKPGHMVTVEPGLYYRKTGGVRIEDIVFVTKTSCQLLATYPKHLEIP